MMCAQRTDGDTGMLANSKASMALWRAGRVASKIKATGNQKERNKERKRKGKEEGRKKNTKREQKGQRDGDNTLLYILK